MRYCRFDLREEALLTPGYEQPRAQVLFLLNGSVLHCHLPDQEWDFELQPTGYTLLMVMSGIYRRMSCDPSQEMEICTMNVDVDTYFRRFGHIDAVDKLPGHLLSGGSVTTWEMRVKMHEIISAMTGLSCNVYPWRLQLETKIPELILLQMETCLSLKPEIPGPAAFQQIRKQAIEKMYARRSHLNQHAAEIHTLREPARRINSDETVVKTSFKLVFGMTVSQCLARIRMRRARQLPGISDMPVSKIAAAVGYTPAPHVPHAFKEYFGFRPKRPAGSILRDM